MLNEYSFKGREECKRVLEHVYYYLLHEMDSNKRIPYDQQAYDYIANLSRELDLYL